MNWAKPLLEFSQQREERLSQEEPPTTPHQLHVVRRVKTLKGRPWWEKQTAEALGLGADTPVRQMYRARGGE